MAKIEVLVADDTLIAREGWRILLDAAADIVVVGEAATIEEVCLRVRQLHPDVVLLDLKWGVDQRAALACLLQLKQESPETKVIAVSAYDGLLTRARSMGADGALPKDFTRDQFLSAIRGVYLEQAGPPAWAVRLRLLAEVYAHRLRDLKPGRSDAEKYEALMAELLPYLFDAHLADFEFLSRGGGGGERPDALAFNSSKPSFLDDHPTTVW